MERMIYPFLLLLFLIQPGDTLFIIQQPVPFDAMRAKWNDYIFSQPCYLGRNSDDAVKALVHCKTLKELLEYVPGRGTYDHIRIRELDLSVSQFDTYGFAKENAEENAQWININGLIHNDSIKFGFIELNGHIQYFKEDQLFLENYLVHHNSFYNTNFTYTNLIAALKQEKSIQIACGNGGSYYAPEAKMMLQSIKTIDKKPLNEFIRSLLPEIQAYGVIGLMALKERGIALSAEEDRITEYLLRRNAEVALCMTCTGGNKPLQFAINYWMKTINSKDFEIVDGRFKQIQK